MEKIFFLFSYLVLSIGSTATSKSFWWLYSPEIPKIKKKKP